MILQEVEPPLLQAVMEKKRGNQLQAAKLLGISRGTIRKKLASSIERNVVHGSDSPESAAYEVPFFFNEIDFVK